MGYFAPIFSSNEEFWSLDEEQKAAEFRKYCWWTIKIQGIVCLAPISPAWLFYYYSIIDKNIEYAVYALLITAILLLVNNVLFPYFFTKFIMPKWVARYRNELYKKEG